MAQMVPAVWEDRNGSHAERMVYERLRDETPDDWLAVHSVGLTSHDTKPWAEIDFVVIGPFGVLCLEVKGGRITVENGRWATNDSPLRESPFRQAGGGAAALHRELKDLFPALSKAIVDYGVVFPEVTFDVLGPGIEPAVVYDDRDLAAPMQKYLERLGDHWLAYHGRTGERFRPLSRAERAAILRYVAPSFDLIPTLRARVSQAEAELVRLTRDQARVLRGLRTKNRAIIRGGAGTGKTLLAVDEAERLASEGSRVLFSCRSPNLARYISAYVDEPLVDVIDYETLLRDIVTEADRWDNLPDADEADLMSVFLPEEATGAIIDLGRDGSYDVLILDEGQDLLIEAALDMYDLLLRDSLDGGRWRVFLDHKQNVFSAVDRRQFDRISSAAVTEYDLIDNCRNTPQISDTTSMLSAVDPDETQAPDGPDVEIRWVLDRQEEPAGAAAIVTGWLRRGVDPAGIVVVPTDEDAAERVRRQWPSTAGQLVPFEVNGRTGPGIAVAAEFKGLEAGAVVVVGVRELAERQTLRRLYVACSRARVLLGVVLDESARPDFELRAVEFARRQTEQAAVG